MADWKVMLVLPMTDVFWISPALIAKTKRLVSFCERVVRSYPMECCKVSRDPKLFLGEGAVASRRGHSVHGLFALVSEV